MRKGVHFIQMIQRFKNKYLGMIVSLMMAVLFVPGIVHAEGYSCIVSIPVEMEVSGENAPAEDFVIVLEAAGEDVPMSEETQITINGSGRGQFEPITYMVPGDYQYWIYQKAGTTQNYTYDDAAYTVTVRVINDGKGGLAAEIWAIEDGQQNKTDRIVFANNYKEPEKEEPAKDTVKTGDTANAAVPTVAAVAALVTIATVWKTKKHSSE